MTGSRGVALRKAVTDGLAAALGALPEFNGDESAERKVRVGYAFDFSSSEAEQVYTGRSRGTTDPAAILSARQTRDELGQFDLNVRVAFVGAESAYDSDLRVDRICQVVEEWIAARKSGGDLVPGVSEMTVRSWEADYAGIDGGAASLRTLRVHWRARLT